MFPGLKTVGVAWNPAEANSRIYTMKAREICQQLGITLLEANVDNSSAVFEAASSLVSRGAEAIWIGGDVTVVVAVESVISAARKGRVPVFTLVPASASKGTLFDLGANFYDVGKLSGTMAAEILKGGNPVNIPVRNITPKKLLINKKALAGLKDNWHVPDEIAASADILIDDSGIHDKSGNR
jgi:ABC-type uncharacterized transport system substrate-binding protein